MKEAVLGLQGMSPKTSGYMNVSIEMPIAKWSFIQRVVRKLKSFKRRFIK